MYKNKIELTTMNDIQTFVNLMASVKSPVKLIDGNGFCVNGKSLLGAVAAVEWDSLYCESEEDIYSLISKFCVS